MISFRFQIIAIFICMFYFMGVCHFIKRKYFKLRYALVWLAIGFALFVLAIFPKGLSWFADFLGIYSAENALFTILIICVFAILITLTIIVSRQSEKVKSLTQEIALLEKRMRDTENKFV